MYLAVSGPSSSTQGFPCGSQTPSLRLWCGCAAVVVHGLQGAGSGVAVHGLCCPGASGILAPQPGVKPVSPAWAGRRLTTALPGKFLIPFPIQHRIIQKFKYSKSLVLSQIPRLTVA